MIDVGSLRQLAWRACYEVLAARVGSPDWAFMNYGYAPLEPDAAAPVLRVEDEADRLCIQLYDHVLNRVDLDGLDVVEVGSGRGGGCSYISRYRGPASVIGVDFSAAAVALSRRRRSLPGLRFMRGDAQDLPLPDGSVDVVVNVESSHCYASMETFLGQVHRVLRPGGVLCFADLRSGSGVDVLRAQLAGCGLDLEHEDDISREVVRAMTIDDARKRVLVDTLIPRVARAPFRTMAGLQGTMNHAALTDGTARYLSARLRRR